MVQPGQRVAGRFEVLDIAGAGGMGTVYRSRDHWTGEQVALKIIDADGEALSRFAREARLLSELSHPGIVGYVDHETQEGSELFLAMEWLEGEDLGARLKRGGLTVKETLALGRRVAEALGAAHSRGAVHRDIKPSNLFLVGGRFDRVKLLDFGIAQFAATKQRLTVTGIAMGTPGYMSPEQVRGARNVDARTDIFALGCVLYECLTGQPAFYAAHAMAMLGRILFDHPEPLSSRCETAPPELDELLTMMLEKDPGRRPVDGAAAATMLAEIPEGDDQERAVSVTVNAAITGQERRVVSVVVMRTDHASDLKTAEWTPMREVRSSAPPADQTAKSVAAPAPPQAGQTEQTLTSAKDDLVELSRIVTSFGGRIERIADGAIVAVLAGGRLPVEQASHAGRCALQMRKAVSHLPMVLASGLAVVDKAMPVGDVLDRAVLSLDVAPPGMVVVDQTTAGLLERHFELRRHDGVVELVQERMVGQATRTLLGKSIPCVGRAKELALLSAAWGAVLDEAQASVVLVSSAAGVGKSRLVAEFVELTKQRPAQAKGEILYAECQSVRVGLAYGLVADVVRRNIGLNQDDEALRARVRSDLIILFGESHGLEVLSVIADLLADKQGGEDEPEVRYRRVRSAVVDWLMMLSRRRPVLLVFENLQWADAPSMRLIGDVIEDLADSPILMLCVARPEVTDRFPRLFENLHRTDIRLAGLRAKPAAELVRIALPDLSDERVDQLVDRAGGNAFFLEELIRVAAHDGDTTLPDTLIGVLHVRFDALDPEARRIMRAASVYGDQVTSAGVAALMGKQNDPTLAYDWLVHLAAEEILVRDPSDTGPDGSFGFRNRMIRDAAYTMLTHDDRRLGHRLAARHLEKIGERNAVVIAEHHVAAGNNEQAVTSYCLAAQQALDGNDVDAALHRVDRAIDCGASGLALGQLERIRGEAQAWRGAFAESQASLMRALTLLPSGSTEWARAISQYSFVATGSGKHAEVLPWVEALLAEDEARIADPAQWSQEADGWVPALGRVIIHMYLLGEFFLAERLLVRLRAWATLVAVDDPTAARIAYSEAYEALVGGRPVAALSRFEAAVEHFRRNHDLGWRFFALMHHVVLLLELGGDLDAISLLEENVEKCEKKYKLSSVLPLLNVCLAFALQRQGRGEDPRVARCLTDTDVVLDSRTRITFRTTCSLMHLAMGEHEEALRAAEEAVDASSSATPLAPRAKAACALALLATGRASEALLLATEAHDALTSGRALIGEMVVRLSFIESLHAVGRGQEAMPALALALERIELVATELGAERAAAWRAVPEVQRICSFGKG